MAATYNASARRRHRNNGRGNGAMKETLWRPASAKYIISEKKKRGISKAALSFLHENGEAWRPGEEKCSWAGKQLAKRDLSDSWRDGRSRRERMDAASQWSSLNGR